MKKHFKIVIEKDESADMYVGEVPGLPGCHTHGKTIGELTKNMQEVIELCLDTKRVVLKDAYVLSNEKHALYY